MAKYNLIASSLIESLSGPGQGNVGLTYSQIKSLYDGDTSSLDIYIGTSDILYVEASLGHRIHVDSVSLYTQTAQDVSDKIGFYFKNIDSGDYIPLSTSYNGTFYFVPNLPTVFAPLKLLLTVSGIEGYISEWYVPNDDYAVSFGEDGTQTTVDLRSDESSNINNIHTVKIKNTSHKGAVHAYACIDYTGKEDDLYIKLSSDNDIFLGLEDGLLLKDNAYGSLYRWDDGAFYNTEVRLNTKITLISGADYGMYTTPVVSMTQPNNRLLSDIFNFNQYDSSFFVTSFTTASGTTLKVDSSDEDFTVEVRSSDLSPMDYAKIFTHTMTESGAYDVIWHMYVLNPVVLNSIEFSSYITYGAVYNSYSVPACFSVTTDNKDYVYFFVGTQTTSPSYYYNGFRVYKFNLRGELLQNKELYHTNGPGISFDAYADFISSGDVLYFTGNYGNYMKNMVLIYDSALNSVATIADVRHAAPDRGGNARSLWIIKTAQPSAYKIDYAENIIASIPLAGVRLVVGNSDGGCWLYTDTTKKLYRYVPSYDGNGKLYYKVLVSFGPVADYTNTCSCMMSDHANPGGLWFCVNNILMHINHKAVIMSTTELAFIPTDIVTSPLGVLVRNFDGGVYCYVDSSGKILYSGTNSKYQRPGVVGVTYENNLTAGAKVLPLPEDPVWGENGSLQWSKVQLSGYFLPKTKYHQVRYTLRTTISGNTPEINNVCIPKPVVIKDIPEGGTKDLYIKTNFTNSVAFREYTTKIKTWWYLPD